MRCSHYCCSLIVAGTPGGLVSSVVTASFFHVYNEKVYDLLATDNENDNVEDVPSSSAIHAPLQVVEMPASSPSEGWPSSPGAATGEDGNGFGDTVVAAAAAAVVDMGAGVGLRALSQVPDTAPSILPAYLGCPRPLMRRCLPPDTRGDRGGGHGVAAVR
jgi:hypothetical protein